MAHPTETLQITATAKDTVELRRVPLEQIGPGMLLIKTTWTMISTGTETICLGRRFAEGTHWEEWVKYPYVDGYCHVGVVEALGAGVTRYKIGDRVATAGPHTQYMVVREDSGIYPIPDEVPDRDAVWAVISIIAQIGVRAVRHELGQDVAVIGLGPIGQLVLQFVKLTGPRRLIAIDLISSRLNWAKAHGATHVLQMSADAAIDPVTKINGGRLCDVVYDVTGSRSAFLQAQQLIRRRGTLGLVGDSGYPHEQRLSPAVIRNSLQIVASHGTCVPDHDTDFTHWTRSNMIQLFFDYLKSGAMRVDDLASHHLSPADCQKIYRQLLDDTSQTMGCQFDWSKVQ